MSESHTRDPLQLLKVVTWRVPRVDAETLEALALRTGEERAFLGGLAKDAGASELVHFPTCQRVLLAVTTPRAPEEAARAVARAFEGRAGRALPEPETLVGFDAFAHLAEVASSLDSLVPGEAQVLGQMKDAFEDAKRLGLAGQSGHGLTHVFPLAFRTAKAVRTNTALFKGKVSLIPLTLDAVEEHLSGIEEPIAFVVGTGEIGRRMAELIRETVPHARVELVSRDSARGISLDGFLQSPPRADLVAFATRTDAAFFGPSQAERARGPGGSLLLVDLSLPRCVEASAAEVEGVRLLALDELTALSQRAKVARHAEIDRARDVLKSELARVRAEYDALPAARVVTEYRREVEGVAASRYERGAERWRDTFEDPEFRKWFDQTIRAVTHVGQKKIVEREER